MAIQRQRALKNGGQTRTAIRSAAQSDEAERRPRSPTGRPRVADQK